MKALKNILKISIFIIVSITNDLSAQIDYLTNLRHIKINIDLNTVSYKLDNLNIIPSSLIFETDSLFSIGQYQIDKGTIHIKDNNFLKKYNQQELHISYRIVPIDFSKSYYHLEESLLKKKDAVIYIGYDNQSEIKFNNDIITEKGINYDGSFARGFSIGNGQSLLLNSNFNMQLAGDLGDGIKVKAAISDDNIPIQPEGNTRLLQEFDRVFIQVSKDQTTITAGDYELKRPKSYFVNYSKQLKGLSAYNISQLTKSNNIKTRASFAVSRAQFNRYTLPTSEGNQGPYKLIGANGERFIIIESGSEKIYEDGRLLTRGRDHDYVINYDQAEVIFTEKKLITKDSRLIVEYEYVDRSYLRSMYALESYYNSNSLDLNFNFYNIQDSKGLTGDTQLDSLDLAILSLSGDNSDLTRRSGIRPFTGERDQSTITYKIINDSILVYSTNPDSAIYTAAFSEVDPNTGNYIIDNQINANGRVYKYVGFNNGSYIPQIQLITPKKSQILSFGANYKPNKNTKISTEISMSNHDLNRFSTIDNEDNKGLAAFLNIEHKLLFGDSLNTYAFSPFLTLEITDKNYEALNPYRATEFTRDWNLNMIEKSNESIFRSGFILKNESNINTKYIYSQYKKGAIYKGNKHNFDAVLSIGTFELYSKSSILTSKDQIEDAVFSRPIFGLNKKWASGIWESGISFEGETNKRIFITTDSLNPQSHSFRIYKAFIDRTVSQKIQFRLSYENRIDKKIENEDFKAFSSSNDLTLSSSWAQSKNSRLKFDFTFRDLKITDTQLTELAPKRSILGQMDYSNKFLNGAISTTTSYNIGSGQQAKIEFDYQEVLPGEGNFDWIDFNNDGIQQSGEFRLSEFQDTSRFIQISLFNNEFIQTNNAGINQSLRLNPKNYFTSKKDKKLKSWQSILKRFSSSSNVRVNKKVKIDGGDFNPFDFGSADTSIVSFNAIINNTIFINRGNPHFDYQLGQRSSQSKIIQISGFEARGLNEWFTRARFSIKTNFDLLIEGLKGNKNGDSEVFVNRNFEITYYKIAPKINYRPSSKLRFVLEYSFLSRRQQINQMEEAQNTALKLDASIRQANKSSWDIGVQFVNVNYTGETNSFVALEILEGLKSGKNYLWNSSFTRRLSGNVDFILNYEGRKTGDSRTIHTGNAQVKATF